MEIPGINKLRINPIVAPILAPIEMEGVKVPPVAPAFKVKIDTKAFATAPNKINLISELV